MWGRSPQPAQRMAQFVILAGKRVGERFPLGGGCAATPLSVRGEDGAAPDRLQLLQGLFLVRLRLECAEEEEDDCSEETEPEELTFRFVAERNPALSFRGAEDVQYELSVARLSFDASTVDFRLEGGALGDAGPLDLGAPHERRAREKNTLPAAEPDEEQAAPEARLDVFILGVHHDAAQKMLEEQLPNIMSQAERDRRLYRERHGMPSDASTEVAVFWEMKRFCANRPVLAPAPLFDAARLTMPLESRFFRLQHAVNAYVLYVLGERQSGKVGLMEHFESKYERSGNQKRLRKISALGRNDIATELCVVVITRFIRTMMALGKEASYDAFLALLGSRLLVEAFIARTVELYEDYILSPDEQYALGAARAEWVAAMRREGRAVTPSEWFFDAYFAEADLVQAGFSRASAHRIRKNKPKFRAYALGLFHLITYGAESEAEAARRLSEEYEGPWEAFREVALGETLQEVLAEHQRARAWAIDERYFAELARLIYATYGHVGKSMLPLLEAAVRKTRRIKRLHDLVRAYRDIESLMNVTHVAAVTGKRRCVLVVGNAHAAPLAELFRAQGHTVESYYVNDALVADMVPAEEDSESDASASEQRRRHSDRDAYDHNFVGRKEKRVWEPFLDAYMAVESLAHWLEPAAYPAVAGAKPLARLQAYFFMSHAARFFYAGARRDSRAERTVSRYMTLFYLLFSTRSPFYSPLALRGGAGEGDAEREDIRAANAGLPGLIVELLVQCRSLHALRVPRIGEEGGKWRHWLNLEADERVDALMAEPIPLDLRHLRTDWAPGMGQLSFRRGDCRTGRRGRREQSAPRLGELLRAYEALRASGNAQCRQPTEARLRDCLRSLGAPSGWALRSRRGALESSLARSATTGLVDAVWCHFAVPIMRGALGAADHVEAQ